MIEIRGLHKRFGRQHVLKGLSLTIPKGKNTVILGRSGEGKSVLLKHIIGLLAPDSGEIWVDGEEICSLKGPQLYAVRRKFAMLFQSAALFDSMTVEENVAFPLREHTQLSDKEIQEIVRENLRLVGLKDVERKLPSELSGGMRKRVGLARAIALKPEILLYDEPTTGLDPIMTDVVDDLIIDMNRRFGLTQVIISHDIHATFKVAHKIAMLHEGLIIEEGNPEAFGNSPNPIVQQFLKGEAAGPVQVH